MNRTKFSHKIVAVFLTLTFLPSLIPVNFLYASNNGPTAPEAASFEPVDATDMVNLATGDLSYVLPLMNVPSPEGGYPLALSYHAGIAMDQEASWVGLGWNLNPGAINRSVNGYPDDWGKTHFSEFFYDKGWTDNYYNFSIGGTLPNGITVGLGASWGSNRAFGGSVQLGYSGLRAGFGQNGTSVGVSAGGFSFNASSNGSTQFGIGSKYGGISFDSQHGFSGNLKHAGIGISIDSNGTGISVANFTGIGVNSQVTSSSAGDYDVEINTRGLNLDFGRYWLGIGHTRVKYSLYKVNNLYASGILYPYQSKNVQRNVEFSSVQNTNFQEYNYLMDAHQIDDSDSFGRNLLPSYDNYSINAQGLSATMQPRIYEEIELYNRGDYVYEQPTWIHSNIKEATKFNVSTPNTTDQEYNIGTKTNFYFTGTVNSYLRIGRTNVNEPSLTELDVLTGSNYNVFNTQNTNAYDETITPDGHQIRNGHKKREGRYIETFTNSDIVLGNAGADFIEAKGFDRVHETDLPGEGIGAYRITTLDGKIYHYSLPVYQFESFQKTFKDSLNPDKNFFEQKKLKQFASHWLLTAVTGPDYIDTNGNGEVDEEDYGYWVEFEYGKWSDGYAWRGPKEGYHVVTKKTGISSEDKTYSFNWGRKQIYYLDAIKTRSHTALFVKELRDDNLSEEITHWKEHYDGSVPFVAVQHAETFRSEKLKDFSLPGETLFYNDGNSYELPYVTPNGHNVHHYKAWIENQKYVDLPKTKTLKLSKIVLLKNADAQYDKTLGNLTNTVEGRIYYNEEYRDIHGIAQGQNTVYVNDILAWETNLYLYRGSTQPKSVHSQLDDNVLDVADIQNTSLETNASKVINFNHDTSYPLAINSSNSEASTKGRLTLNRVHFGGKGGQELIPPYKFYYNKSNIPFDADKTDNWGYHETDADAWSLNQIITPTGGKIKMTYEDDSFHSPAIGGDFSELVDHKFWSSPNNSPTDTFITSIEKGDDFIKVFYRPELLEFNLNHYFSLGQYATVEFNKQTHANGNYYNSDLTEYGGQYYRVHQTQGKDWLILKTTDESTYFEDLVDSACYGANPEDLCISYFKVSAYSSSYTLNDPNGRQKGGIRVKDIKTVDEQNNEYTTEYGYLDPYSAKTSGITSYEPFDDDGDGVDIHYPNSYLSEIPSPGVIYEYVTVTSKDATGNPQGYSTYHFDVMKPYLGNPQVPEYENLNHFGVSKTTENQLYYAQNDPDYPGNNATVYREKVTVQNKVASLGRLLSVKSYNKQNHLLDKTVNNYRKDLDTDYLIGTDQESFISYSQKLDINSSTKYNFRINSTSRIEYPSVLESTTTTQGGYTSTTYYDKHDFLTGQVLETRTYNSKGKAFKQQVVPAYHIAAYQGDGTVHGMNAKVDNVNNKNMLTQEAAAYSYIQDTNGNWQPTGVGITTWNNEWTYRDQTGVETTPTANDEKIWRKHKAYSWKGAVDANGVFQNYNMATDDDFVWDVNGTQTNSKWEELSEITRYDHYSMPLETKDINSNYASTKMGDDDTKILASGNAQYTEMFASGAEYIVPNTTFFDGEMAATGQSKDMAHTGDNSVKTTTGVQGFKVTMKANEHRAGKYKVSVWADKASHTNAKVNTGSGEIDFNGEIIPAGDWVQLNHYFDVTTAVQDVYVTAGSGTVYYDDFRLLPIVSTMSTYVYNSADELTHILDGSNLATMFEYDSAGRLCKTYAEVVDNATYTGGFKPVSKNRYNYKGIATNGSCSGITASLTVTPESPEKDALTTIAIMASLNIGTLTQWELDLGDGTVQNGTGTPPATVTHTYTVTGNKQVKLTLTDSEGDVEVVIKEIMVKDPFYFADIVTSASGPTTAKLYGPIGEPITYGATTGGSSNDHSATIIVNGNTTTLGAYGSVSGQSGGTIPSTGYVNCSVEVTSSGGNSSSASLTIQTASGTITLNDTNY